MSKVPLESWFLSPRDQYKRTFRYRVVQYSGFELSFGNRVFEIGEDPQERVAVVVVYLPPAPTVQIPLPTPFAGVVYDQVDILVGWIER